MFKVSIIQPPTHLAARSQPTQVIAQACNPNKSYDFTGTIPAATQRRSDTLQQINNVVVHRV